MRIELPPAARIPCAGDRAAPILILVEGRGDAVGAETKRLVFHHRIVGVAIAQISGRLAEIEKVLGQAAAHARAVLALLSPPEAIGLVVLPYDVGDDRLPGQ